MYMHMYRMCRDDDDERLRTCVVRVPPKREIGSASS